MSRVTFQNEYVYCFITEFSNGITVNSRRIGSVKRHNQEIRSKGQQTR